MGRPQTDRSHWPTIERTSPGLPAAACSELSPDVISDDDETVARKKVSSRHALTISMAVGRSEASGTAPFSAPAVTCASRPGRLRRPRRRFGAVLACCALVAMGCTGSSGDSSDAERRRSPCPGFIHGPTGDTPVDLGRGDLAVAVGDFVSAIGGKDSGDYRPPSLEERTAFARAWNEPAPLPAKRAALDAFGYDVFLFDDTAPDPQSDGVARWVVACERRNSTGTWDLGWGLYLASERPSLVVVEVPHPRFDRRSEDIGVAVARRTGGTFLLAGAHRHANGDLDDDRCAEVARCADMSHQPASVFQAVHDVTINPPECREASARCRGFAVVQPHGFATRLHRGIGDIAISDGTSDPMAPGSLIDRLAVDLERASFDVCRFEAPGDCAGVEEDGAPGTSLGATRNVQGISAREAVPAAAFIHVEVSKEVRDKPTGDLSRRRVGEILGARLRGH